MSEENPFLNEGEKLRRRPAQSDAFSEAGRAGFSYAEIEQNPFEVLEGGGAPVNELTAGRVYGGIGRLAWGILIIAGGVFSVMFFGIALGGFSSLNILLMPIALTIAAQLSALFLCSLRLKNAGVSRWFTALSVIPYIKYLLFLFCLAVPEGYGDHRQLDWPGRLILYFAIISIVVNLVVLVIIEFM